jgi:hypothetical protein
MPILIVSPSARATRENAGAARLATSPRFTDRLVGLMRSSAILFVPIGAGELSLRLTAPGSM